MTKEQTEYYGSLPGSPQEILDSRIFKMEQELREMSKEQERRNAFTPDERLADRLHLLLHYGVDCDYHYSQWPHANGCRYKMRELAISLRLLYNGVDGQLNGIIQLLESGKNS